MCMIFGSSVAGEGTFIVTDTRTCERYDTGGRLIDTGTGFAIAGGSHDIVTRALAVLRDAGPVESDAIAARLGTLRCGLASAGFTPHQDRPRPRDGNFLEVLFIESEAPDLLTFTTGAVHESWKDGEHVAAVGTLPPERSRYHHERIGGNFAQLAEFGASLGDRIRLAAKHFHDVSLESSSMSGEMEIGYIVPKVTGTVRGYLRGSADDIMHAPPSEILSRFGADCPNRLADEVLGFNPAGKMDNLADGASFVRTTPLEKAGGGRAATVIDSGYNINVKGSGSTPGIAALKGLGAGGSLSIAGTDSSGRITMTLGTGSAGSGGDWLRITFATTKAADPVVLLALTGDSGDFKIVRPSRSGATGASFDVWFDAAPLDGFTYFINYVAFNLD